MAIKVKFTHSIIKTVLLKQTFLAIKLQTSEFSMVLLVVVTHEVWKKQCKNLVKWPHCVLLTKSLSFCIMWTENPLDDPQHETRGRVVLYSRDNTHFNE